MRNLSETGLSMSQAQSISNLCNQKSIEITNKINAINNSSSKIQLVGADGKVTDQTIDKAVIIPENIVELLSEKSRLHACQAFLMIAITGKNNELEAIKKRKFVSDLQIPEEPIYDSPTLLKNVDESWGWDKLSDSDYNKFIEAEAYASHIGQFIHDGGKLDSLRKELPKIQGIKWFEIEAGKKMPIIVTCHNTPEDLYELHEKLAVKHREYEQTVNYYKAKVKNLVTEENARIAKENSKLIQESNTKNAKLRSEYEGKYENYLDELKSQGAIFEEKRQDDIKSIVNLRIKVDARFQDVIDAFMPKE